MYVPDDTVIIETMKGAGHWSGLKNKRKPEIILEEKWRFVKQKQYGRAA